MPVRNANAFGSGNSRHSSYREKKIAHDSLNVRVAPRTLHVRSGYATGGTAIYFQHHFYFRHPMMRVFDSLSTIRPIFIASLHYQHRCIAQIAIIIGGYFFAFEIRTEIESAHMKLHVSGAGLPNSMHQSTAKSGA